MKCGNGLLYLIEDEHVLYRLNVMQTGICALTDREKDTLRLLVAGHDAKSIARDLGLSVHTVNERLRDTRRKLGVSSSREAARLFLEAENGGHNFLTDKEFGVADTTGTVRDSEQRSQSRGADHRLAWLVGGMLIMSLIMATLALSTVYYGGDEPAAKVAQASVVAPAVTGASQAASLGPARSWTTLLDRQRWEESWREAATLFKSQISAAQWAATIRSVRLPLGPVSARTFQNVTKATSLPGAPAGEYEIIQFQTNFAQRAGAIETVVLSREQGNWKVAGYFIK